MSELIYNKQTSTLTGLLRDEEGDEREVSFTRQDATQSLQCKGRFDLRIFLSSSEKRVTSTVWRNDSESRSFVSSLEAAEIVKPASSSSSKCFSNSSSSFSGSAFDKKKLFICCCYDHSLKGKVLYRQGLSDGEQHQEQL